MLEIFKLDFNDLHSVLSYEREKENHSINDLRHQKVSKGMKLVLLQSEWAKVILGIQTIKACI
jgi:hypothetical protein